MPRKFASSPTWVSWFMVLALGFTLAACSSPEERARAHYESGKQLLDGGDFIKAGLEFRNALKYNEKLAIAWLGLASVEEEKQNWPVVASSLQRAVELEPKNVQALTKLAKMQLAANQIDVALKNINEANNLKKDDTDILALRAAILFRLNDREGARADAERSLALNPDNLGALSVLAADQYHDKNTVGALRFVERGLLKSPNDLGLLLFKVKIYEETKDDAKLEAVLRQIIGAYPDLKQLRQALLAFLASRNRTADVEAEMRAWIKADPADTSRAMELVQFVRAVRGAPAARTELEKFIAENPDKGDYRLALAKLDYSEGKTDAATQALEAIISKAAFAPDVLQARLLLADASIRAGNTERAKALIAEVLAGDAKNADALALRASMSLTSGDVDNAVADLREALNQQPNSVPLLNMLGRAHERQGSVDLANDRLVQAVKASNYNPQVTLDYLSFLSRRGNKLEAETILNEAVARNPQDPRLLRALAQHRLNKQDWVGAQAAGEALKKIGDTSGAIEEIQGAVLLGQKKYEESIEMLKQAFNTAPQTVQPMYSLIQAYIASGKIAEAETFLQSTLAANPKNANAHVLMGGLKALQKLPAEAEAAFKLATESEPNNPTGYTALAQHYLLQKQDTQAEAVLKAGREKISGDLSLNLIWAGLLERRNDIEGAIAVYEEQLKSTPDAVIVINNLASLLADNRTDAQSFERASQLAQRLEAIDVPQFKDTVGWVAYRRGDYRGALLNLQQAAEKLPTLALVKYHLALTYVALKRPADAKEQFEKADALLAEADPLKEKIRVALSTMSTSN